MATTCFFEETIVDKAGEGKPMAVELGRSSYVDGESLIYLVVNGKSVILDEKMGRQLYEAMDRLGSYLGYDR